MDSTVTASSSTAAYEISVRDDAVVVGGVSADTERVFLFVNGVSVWSDDVAETGGGAGGERSSASVIVPVSDLAATAATPDAPALVQAYGVDRRRRTTGFGGRSLHLPLLPAVPDAASPTPRGTADRAARLDPSAAADPFRLFASSVHRPGDTHRWTIPLSWLTLASFGTTIIPPSTGGAGESPIQFAIRFRCDEATVAATLPPAAGAEGPLAKVSFVLHVSPDVAAAEAVFTIQRDAGGRPGEVVFESHVPPSAVTAAASIRMEVTAAVPAGGPSAATASPWRYAVYGALSRETTAPPPPMTVGGGSPWSAAAAVVVDSPPSTAIPPPPPPPPPTAMVLPPPPPPPTPVVPQKRALLIGVSRYRRRTPTDLEFCNEDVANWYQYLTARGFRVEILGDEFSPYPVWHGPATVLNARAAVRRMVAEAGGAADRMALVVSSHGSGDKRGDSYICLLPDPAVGRSRDEKAGVYHDYEIAADLSAGGRNAAHNFIFFDLCLSGGIIPELLQALPRVIGTTTATRSGVGYDSHETHSGAWTHYFLKQGLVALATPMVTAADTDLVQVFEDAHRDHTNVFQKVADRPCFFARSEGTGVYNTEPNHALCYLPRNTFMLSEWL